MMKNVMTLDHIDEKNRWWTWMAIAIGVFMATLDSSIVNISLPNIARSLHSDLPSTQWVVLAYMLGISGILLPLGRLSDLWGRRKVYVGGMIIFTVGSFLCGVSHSVGMLIVMRALQAVGAAGLMSSGTAVTAEVFQTDRGKALGLTGSVVSIGAMLGPSLGGWIVQAGGWPWIFWVNVPVGILATFFAWKMLEPYDTPHLGDQSFDFWGAFLSMVALLSLMLLLTYGLGMPWYDPSNMVLFVTFLGTTWAFIKYEKGTPHPMVAFELFRERLLTNACVASFLAFIGITFIFFLMPFYLQLLRGLSPWASGWILMTSSLALFIFSPLSGSLSDRIGSRNLAIVGMLISALGLWLIATFGIQTTLPKIVLGLFLVGMGNGLFQPPNNNQMLGAVPPHALGLVGGMLAIVRTLGMTAAVALVGFIYSYNHAELSDPQGFLHAFRMVFILGTVVTVLNAVWIRWYRPKGPES
jgi:EmrB/QacA subfamily drug resistance transporter